jgi:hypothetical protein
MVARGVHRLRTSLPALLQDADNGLTFASRELFQVTILQDYRGKQIQEEQKREKLK